MPASSATALSFLYLVVTLAPIAFNFDAWPLSNNSLYDRTVPLSRVQEYTLSGKEPATGESRVKYLNAEINTNLMRAMAPDEKVAFLRKAFKLRPLPHWATYGEVELSIISVKRETNGRLVAESKSFWKGKL